MRGFCALPVVGLLALLALAGGQSTPPCSFCQGLEGLWCELDFPPEDPSCILFRSETKTCECQTECGPSPLCDDTAFPWPYYDTGSGGTAGCGSGESFRRCQASCTEYVLPSPTNPDVLEPECIVCAPGYWGPNCANLCPGMSDKNMCNGRGSCNDGIEGTGECTCDPGFAGTNCDLSDLKNCNGNGKVHSVDGTTPVCTCNTGYTGPSCQQCSTDYYGYPNCRFCTAAATCKNKGTCTGSGACQCVAGVTGASCDRCATNYYVYPTCKYCHAATSCSGKGTCNSNGDCVCLPSFTGPRCNECKPGYYGSNCLACPGGAANPCSANQGRGTCSQGITGTGVCTCNSPWIGSACQYSDATTCNSHGIAQYLGHCVCELKYAGTKCEKCATHHYNYPTCKYCHASIHCNGHGTCNSQGDCVCFEGFKQDSCDKCVGLPYYNYPNCRYCTADGTCNNWGTCDELGFCVCADYHIGGGCDQCVPWRYGPTCERCICVDWAGDCDEGFYGSGKCLCHNQYWGPRCDYPTLTTIMPTSGPSEGSTSNDTYITLRGYFQNQIVMVNVTSEPVTEHRDEWIFFNSIHLTNIIMKPIQPPTGGTVRFQLLRHDGIASPTIEYHIIPPAIFQYEPRIGPTSGGQMITLTGTSFCFQQTIYWAGHEVTNVTKRGHTELQFPSPEGSGMGTAIQVECAGQWSNIVRYNYLPPVITEISPTNGPTSGGTRLTITGENLGSWTTGPLSANIKGMPCLPQIHTHNQIVCLTPQGSEIEQRFELELDGQMAEGEWLFDYDGPTVTSLEGCEPHPDGVGIRECYPFGGTRITVNGYSFGWGINAGGKHRLEVHIDGKPCTDLQMTIPHEQVTCLTPSGAGKNLTVTVFRGDQLSSAYLFSYAGPVLFTGSLRRVGQQPVLVGGRAMIDAPNTLGGELLELKGRNLESITGNLSRVLLTFGPLERPDAFVCNVTYLYNDTIRCRTPRSSGRDLRFMATVDGVFSEPSDDFINYPPPRIFNLTLRAGGDPVSAGKDLYVSGTTQGEAIMFDGEHFSLNQDENVITYGEDIDNPPFTAYQCMQLTNGYSTSRIHCQTSPGAGTGLRFRIAVGYGSSAQVAIGFDQYSYPNAPSVRAVEGCQPRRIISGNNVTYDYNQATECPTEGVDGNGNPVLITVTGTNFGPDALVTVGGNPCVNVRPWPGMTDRRLTCQLPPGVGTGKLVVVRLGRLYSLGQPLVSYALPDIQAVFGCDDFRNDTYNCTRFGDTRVKLTGQYFGAQRAKVVVGGEICSSVQHNASIPHREVFCRTPPGVQMDRTVLLIQNEGEIANKGRSISYKQCEAGTYAGNDGKDLVCSNCAPGRYTATWGQKSCLACPAGYYADKPASTGCLRCPVGTYSPGQGYSACLECQPGYFQADEAQVTCKPCVAGTMSSNSSASACVPCGFGYFQPNSTGTTCFACPAGSISGALGQAACQACDPGRYADSPGLGQCEDCIPGTYSEFTTPGSTRCLPCPPGTLAGASGLSVCQPCPAGTFSSLVQTNMSEPGADKCEPCEAGSFSASTGATTCTACVPGRFAPNDGALSCEPCPIGTFAANSSALRCEPCPRGTAQPGNGASACEPCALGKAVSSSAQPTCEVCKAGSFANVTGLSACTLCAAGRFSGAGQTACTRCAVGRFAGLPGSAYCAECDLGNIAALQGMLECSSCLEGKIANATGLSFCSDCAPGYFAPAKGSMACVPCSLGRFSSGYGASSCEACPTGSYQAELGQSSCIQCLPGTIAATQGLFECSHCTSGRYANATGLSACTPCARGSYVLADPLAEAGPTACELCQSGTFSDVLGASSCSPCAPGSVVGFDGATTCSQCALGKYADLQAMTQCKICDVGTYAPTLGSTGCPYCAEGTFADLPEMSACKPCPAGQYIASQGATGCLSCGTGLFNPSIQQTGCVVCSPGTFSNATGLSACHSCPLGKYQSNPGRTVCIDCNPGYIASVTGLQSCEPCATGTYAVASGMSGCVGCAEGKFAGVIASTTCTNCSVGTYTATTAASQCLPCEAGSIQPLPGMSFCSQCFPGDYQSNTGTTQCDLCQHGTISVANGAVLCTRCRAGTYLNRTRGTVCDICPEGTYQPALGARGCIDCAPGTVNSQPQQPACARCQPGTYQNETRQQTCRSCTRGYYQAEQGATACDPCPAGSFSSLDGASVCALCGAGEYQDVPGSTGCKSCPEGTYQPQTGASACSPCANGTYNAMTNQPKCIVCPAGTFAGAPGLTECEECPEGTYQPGAGESACLKCAPGSFSTRTRALACLPCEIGKFQNVSGETVCRDCQAGSYQSQPGAEVCALCDSGKYSISTAQTSCLDCPMGRSTDSVGARECVDCRAGYHQPRDGQPSCLPCMAGTISAEPRAVVCNDCPKGYYQNQNASTICLICPEGTYRALPRGSECTRCETGRYNPNTQQESCARCPPGTATTARGQTACTACLPGYFTGSFESSECSPCRPGRYADINGTTECNSCERGRYTDRGGLTTCMACPPGRAQPGTGESICSLCAAGRFNSNPGQLTCSECPAGRASRAGATECDDCQAGFFQSRTGQEFCEECPRGYFSTGERGTTCIACLPGQHLNRTGGTGCRACGLGKSQFLEGRALCDDCPAGQYQQFPGASVCDRCEPGYAQNVTGETGCFECQPGFFQDREGQSACEICPVGRFSSKTGGVMALSECRRCPAGRHMPYEGASECLPCPGGTFQTLEGETGCVPCPIGHYSTGAAPACTLCNERYAAPWTGMNECVPCDEFGDANARRSTCVCQAGFYLNTSRSALAASPERVLNCLRCPSGAYCDYPGVTYENMQTRSGWWRSDNRSLAFFRCLISDHCLGGEGAGKCQENRVGTLCAVCREGYQSSNGINECEKCPDDKQAIWLSVLFIILVVAAVIALYVFVLYADADLVNQMQAADMRQIEEWDIYSPDQVTDRRTGRRVVPEEKTANLTYKIKILIGFLQISTNMAFVVEVPWPSGYAEFISWFDIVNFDIIPWQSVGCVAPMTYYTKFLVISCVPLGVLFLLFLFFLLPLYIMDAVRERESFERFRAARKRARRKFWKLVLFTTFCIYPNVSSTVLGMFVCRNINGTIYLVNDFRLTCFNSEWFMYFPVALAMVGVYPLGIPALFFYWLYKYRHRRNEPGIRLQLGFLFLAYDPKCWWFEMVEMLYKLTMTSLIAFFPPDAQMPMGLGTIYAFFLAVLLLQPYERRDDDRLQLLAVTETMLFILVGYILFDMGTDRLDVQTDAALSFVLIALTCFLFVVFVALMVFSFRTYIRQRQRKLQAAAEKEADLADVDAATQASLETAVQMDRDGGEFVNPLFAGKDEFSRARAASHVTAVTNADGDLIELAPIVATSSDDTPIAAASPAEGGAGAGAGKGGKHARWKSVFDVSALADPAAAPAEAGLASESDAASWVPEEVTQANPLFAGPTAVSLTAAPTAAEVLAAAPVPEPAPAPAGAAPSDASGGKHSRWKSVFDASDLVAVPRPEDLDVEGEDADAELVANPLAAGLDPSSPQGVEGEEDE